MKNFNREGDRGDFKKKSFSGGRGGFGGGRSDRGGFGGGGGRSERGGFGGERRDRGDRPEMFKTICADCGQPCEVPFKPSGLRPVYCSQCFKNDHDHASSPRMDSRPSNMRPERSEVRPENNQMRDKLESINAKLDQILNLLGKTAAPIVPKVSQPELIIEPVKIAKIVKKVSKETKKVVKKAIKKAIKK
ncbi:MAG: CxxC-x17-CxxC domain-containing protein [Patescibacteria group bacterium]